MTHVKRINPIVKLNLKLQPWIQVSNTGTELALNNKNKKLIYKNCIPFSDCISEIYNTQVLLSCIIIRNNLCYLFFC